MMGMKKKALNYSDTKSGFTMVELSLTMAFVAVLLITIAVITSNIMTIYQKGLTIKAVNSVGRGLTDEFITGISTAPAVDTVSLCNNYLSDGVSGCKKTRARNFVFQEYRENKKQLYGVFCSGNYSYLWNTHYGYDAGKTVTIKYIDPSGEHPYLADSSNGKKAPRLVRIKDTTYRLCSAVTEADYDPILEKGGITDTTTSLPGTRVIDITHLRNGTTTGTTDALKNTLPEAPEQGMLSAFDLDLELYEFMIFPISQDNMTLRTYMSGTFTLATTRGNIDISRSGDYCQPDKYGYDDAGNLIEGDTSSLNDLGSEFNYCAINKFNFAARTAGVD